MENEAVLEVPVPLVVQVRFAVAGQGAPQTVAVEAPGEGQEPLTVGQFLAAHGHTLAAGESVSVNGTVVNPDDPLDLGGASTESVPLVLVAPRVNNGF